MKDVAIVGLPASGKSTVFTAVSRHVAHRGSATQAVVDVPGIDPHSLQAARAADALAIVLRAFGHDADVRRDLDSFHAELAVADLATVERVAERAAKKAKSGDGTAKLELEICERAEHVLSEGRWLWDEDWSDEQRRVIGMWTPLTFKPVLHVVNAEDPAGNGSGVPDPHVLIAGALEAEATELPEEEAALLLREYGVNEPAAGRFVRAAYDAIGLVTFFTAGPTEAHAWAVPTGAKAPQAAGAVHSDFENKFIRAERVAFDAVVAAGSEDAARQQGLLRAEGKDYVVREGDILLILHSA